MALVAASSEILNVTGYSTWEGHALPRIGLNGCIAQPTMK